MIIGLIVGILFCAGVLFFQHRNKDQQTPLPPKGGGCAGAWRSWRFAVPCSWRGCWGSAGMWSYPPGTGC